LKSPTSSPMRFWHFRCVNTPMHPLSEALARNSGEGCHCVYGVVVLMTNQMGAFCHLGLFFANLGFFSIKGHIVFGIWVKIMNMVSLHLFVSMWVSFKSWWMSIYLLNEIYSVGTKVHIMVAHTSKVTEIIIWVTVVLVCVKNLLYILYYASYMDKHWDQEHKYKSMHVGEVRTWGKTYISEQCTNQTVYAGWPNIVLLYCVTTTCRPLLTVTRN
jgi:hypothetical protein